MDFHCLTLPSGLFLMSFLALKKKKIPFILRRSVGAATLRTIVPARRLEINYIAIMAGTRAIALTSEDQLPSGTQGPARNSLPEQTALFWP